MPLPVQAQSFGLAGSGTAIGDTSLTLKSFKRIDGTTNLTMADFGGTVGYGTLEPQAGTKEEPISFSGVTQNSNGTATLTGVKTNLTISPYTETSGIAQTHAGGVTFIITNTAPYENKKLQVDVANTVTALHQYNTLPQLNSDPVNGTDAARRSWVLSVISGGSISTNAIIVSATAGATIAKGNIVYLDTTTGTWKLATSATASTVDNITLGIAQGAGVAAAAITGGVLMRGLDTTSFTGLTANTVYYCSTAGAIATTPGTTKLTLGMALSTTSFFFDPRYTTTLTELEKISISANSYRSSDYDQSQTTQDSSSTFGAANSTTKRNKIAQSFVSGFSNNRGVQIYKSADTGTFTGTVTVAIQADSSGSPSGVNLASITLTNAQWLALAVGANDIVFTAEYATTIGSTYWMVFSTSTSDDSNHPNLGTNSVGGYASGSVKFNNTTDGWVAIATIDLYFRTLNGIVSQVPKTDPTMGSISGTILPYSLLDINTTDTTVSSSASETTVYTKELVGGFSATSGFRIKGNFTGSNDQTSTDPVIKIKVNGSTIATITGAAVGVAGVAANAFTGYWEATIVNQGSVSSQSYVTSCMKLKNSTLSALTNIYGGWTTSEGTSAVSTAGPAIITVTYTMSGILDSFTHKNIILEKIGY